MPAPFPAPSYTVVRTRSVTSISTSATGQKTVMICGQWNDGAATPQVNVLPFHAVYGVGTNVPGTTESYVVDPLLAGASAGAYNLSLHAMTVVVTTDGSATSGVGTFYMGSIPSRINRLGFATWNALGTNLESRREMLPITAYQSLSESERYSTRVLFPLDMVTYSQFDPSAANTTGSAIQLNDGLSPCFIVWEPTSAAVSYNVSIFVEWRVIYNTDVQLASTQVNHPVTSPSMWQQMTSVASSLAGNLASAASVMGGINPGGPDASLTGAIGNWASMWGTGGLGLSKQATFAADGLAGLLSFIK